MKRNILITVSTVLMFCACNNKGDTKTEYYNPIGCDYNTIIEHFGKNNLVYMRMVSDMDNSFLYSFDHYDTINKCYYFNDDNICYGFQWIYMSPNTNFDDVAKYVNKGFKKIPYVSTGFLKTPYDSTAWEDMKQNQTCIITKDDKTGWFSLWCKSEKYHTFNEQDDRIIVDFSNVYRFDPEEEEWYEFYKGEYNAYDKVTDNILELTFSTDRFVIPRDLEGKIEHFRNQGKILTYEIIYRLGLQDDFIRLMVKDEDDTEFCFAVNVDFSRVVLLYDDRTATLFSND